MTFLKLKHTRKELLWTIRFKLFFFLILQYAKLRMLEFYYNCLTQSLNPNSFELCETDTDSICMAIITKNLNAFIRNELREQYNKEIFHSCLYNETPK